MLLLFIASALVGSGVLFHHKRILTYIALAGALFEAQMLLTSLLHRTLVTSMSGPAFYLLAGIVFCTFWIACYKFWKSPYSSPGSGKRDAYVGLALVVVLIAAYPIISSNGYVGNEFVLHGFYNGDVATFGSLVQKSFTTNRLVQENPFSANGSLEYPTLLHGGVADFFSLLGISKDWLRYLELMSYAQIFLTIPMFFLVWDTVHAEPKNPAEKWFGLTSRNAVYALQLLITLGVIGLSLDTFVYPQSHFFLMGIFLAVLALFTKSIFLHGKAQLLTLSTAFVFALLLISANSVTGTVAIALAGTLCLIRIFEKKRPIPERSLFLIGSIALFFVLQYASNGRTALNNPHFSVSSAGEMLRAGLPALFVLGAAFYSLSRKQYISIATGVVSLLGFVVFFLSDRDIVTENASRFLYHGVLIGFVLLLPLAIQLLYWIKRELLFTTRPMSELLAGWAIVLCATCIFLLPIGISAGNTYLSLVKSDPHRISANMRIVLWWIDDYVSPNEVVITNPNEPFIVPLFTGRAMVRARDYWLSLDDDVAENVEKAYLGDKAAQQEVLTLGSFLLLTEEDAKHWDASSLKKVADSGEAKLYATR